MSVDDVSSQLTSDAATSRLVGEEPDLGGTQAGPSSGSQPGDGPADLSSSGSQPDADNPQPKFLVDQQFPDPGQEVWGDLIVRTGNHKYVLKTRLSEANTHRISRMCRMAIYDHVVDGPFEQSRQVFAILFHELDHASTTEPQKRHYH